MKIFLGSRNLNNKNTRLEYYILCNKHNYGVQIYKRENSISTNSAVINISKSKNEAIYMAAKLLKEATPPEMLKQSVQNMKIFV